MFVFTGLLSVRHRYTFSCLPSKLLCRKLNTRISSVVNSMLTTTKAQLPFRLRKRGNPPSASKKKKNYRGGKQKGSLGPPPQSLACCIALSRGFLACREYQVLGTVALFAGRGTLRRAIVGVDSTQMPDPTDLPISSAAQTHHRASHRAVKAIGCRRHCRRASAVPAQG